MSLGPSTNCQQRTAAGGGGRNHGEWYNSGGDMTEIVVVGFEVEWFEFHVAAPQLEVVLPEPRLAHAKTKPDTGSPRL